jgi:phospholipase D-like protein
MPFFYQPFTDLGSLLVSLFWILMLIDAATNKSIRGSRVWWMLLVVFTHVFGAVIYFCAGNPYLPRKIYGAVRQWYQQQQARPPQPTPRLYQDYQQGYRANQPQAYEPPPSAQEYEQQAYPSYEQPQASYPEMPQQQ